MKKAKHAGGRPTTYKPEYVELAYNYCILGATDEQLAEFFHVTRKTIDTWKKTYPEFSDALNRGKTVADADIARSLYHRAKGYSHPEEKVFCNGGEIITHPVIKHYPPDTVACIFWLKNRQPKLWRDKVEVKEDVVVRVIPWEQLREITNQALAEAEEKHQRLIVGRAERLGITVDYESDFAA